MKLSHKMMIVSTVALIGVSPIISASAPVLVQAANESATKKDSDNAGNNDRSSKQTKASKKGTIKLSHNAYVYDKNGKRLKTYMGSAKYTKIPKDKLLNYREKVTIANQDYYDIGSGAFVKAANVGYVDGKKVVKATKTTTAKIKRNAYIYDAKGKTDKKKLKKGQTVNVDQLIYISKKLYYRISGQTNQFIKAANVGTVTGPKLKPVTPAPAKDESLPNDKETVITLSRNAYLYDGNGESSKTLIKKGQQLKVDQLKYIGKKLYYRINDSNYPGTDQWVKKSNVGVIAGKQLKPVNAMPEEDKTVTTVTLARNANVYNDKGVKQSTKTFAKDHTARVTELRYIWVEADNKAELFYKLQSDKNGYLKEADISMVSGAKLVPVNTPETAKNETVTATDTDKKALQDALTDATKVKADDSYKLATKSLRDAYDAAVTSASQINAAVSTIAQVNGAVAKLNTAKAALNGKKVQVKDLTNLTVDEANQIVKLAATANGVDASAVQFSNNNTVLTVTNANGFQQTLNISDYAVAAK
ncbi:SLAP domain-containing protein [Lactobacillus xylocopicola]|uniref:Cell division protein n=1 Tax=Lactobacillus xylocopicola TaxID=2976676 RepID=A0ABM8BIR7_9LACO|nr:SLAP domain-containing protein [Lactobacillus xylocopicola]BDR61002.1 cell division protein [Lactobacillus xylocopicola]